MMKRKSDGKMSMVYAYGVCIDPESNEHVMLEVEKQRAMWDSLVIADRETEKKTEQMMIATSPEYASASIVAWSALEVAHEVLKMRNAERSKTRKKTTSFDAAVKDAFSFYKKCNGDKWTIAKKWRKENSDIVKRLRVERYQALKKIRQNSGLYWSNYNRVLDNYEASRKNCMKKGLKVRLSDWGREDGVLTVQIQRTKTGLGAAPEELMDGTLSMFQIGYVDPGVEKLPRNRRKKACRTMMEMRIDAAGHMLRVPMFFHRPLPANCRVKNVQLAWKRECERIKGRLCLNISMEKPVIKHSSKMACGIDLGWRKNPDNSLLVATVYDSGNQTHRLVLDSKYMGGMDQVDRLKSYMDQNAIELLGKIHTDAGNIPDIIIEVIKNYSQASVSGSLKKISMRKIADIVRFHITENMADELPEYLLDWYKRYRHLKTWMDNLRCKLILRRREIYRIFAKKLAVKYAIIGMEDMDLSKMALVKKNHNGEDNELHFDARRQRVLACVHVLRSEIEHQAVKHGSEIIYATNYTTMRCVSCGEITRQSDRAIKKWVCEKCGSKWDQDINAGKNLLAVAVGEKEDYHPIKPKNKHLKNNNNPLEIQI